MAIMLPERDHAINLRENDVMLANEAEDVDGVIMIPGADALLRTLEPFPHAIVTSANVALMTARMRQAGLTVPTLAVTAENVSASKPDPEGFLRGAELLGVSPADCVVFEDSGAGIRAGLAAGMRVIGVGPHAAAYEPTFLVDDLTQVKIDAKATASRSRSAETPAPSGAPATTSPRDRTRSWAHRPRESRRPPR